MINKYVVVTLVMCCLIVTWFSYSNSTHNIPIEQFKLNNFDDDLWHPYLSKAQIDNNNFVLVDNYHEHLKRNKRVVTRLQLLSNSDGAKEVFGQNFYDEDAQPDTKLPGQDATDKGPFNWAWKFTLADAPETDNDNYRTVHNQGGKLEEGMIGEYVNLYDTNRDENNPHAVGTSGTNSDPNGTAKNNEKSEENTGRVQTDTDSKTQVPSTDSNQGFIQTGIQNPQVVYVPVYVQTNSQVNQPQANNYMQQPVYLQQGQQIVQQGGGVNQGQTVSQNGFQQVQPQYIQAPINGQVQYVQQPVYVQQPQPVSRSQVLPNVGMGLNQVPTLVYLPN